MITDTGHRWHDCDALRACIYPTTGSLALFIVRGDRVTELNLFGLPVEQARAIVAACEPCDLNGNPVGKRAKVEAEP